MLRRRLGAWLPARASSQLIALLILSVLSMHVVMTIIFTAERRNAHIEGPGRTARVATIINLMDMAPAGQRTALLAIAQQSYPEFAFSLLDGARPGLAASAGEADRRDDPGLEHLREVLGPGIAVSSVQPVEANGGLARFQVRLRDGAILTGMLDRGPMRRWNGLEFALLFLAISITLLVTWCGSQLTAPLRSLARSAEGYSLDGPEVAFRETGTQEIRSAAQALNRMQQRIAMLVAERTRMLAAVSHDLRTPITRLRLRAEFMQDETARNRTLIDLDQMELLVSEALAYLRGGSDGEAPRPVDLASIVHTIADRFTDLGTAVPCAGVEHVTVCVRPFEIDRAITNLVENALRHAGGAQIAIAAQDDMVTVDVIDEGPGIPDAEKAAVFEPFVRGDPARNLTTGAGLGLGLTIARAIATANGGRLRLLDGQPRGLTARLELPLAKA